MSKQRIIVVGNGMVGHHFIETLIAKGEDNYQIITFSEEPRLAYNRVQLSSYFSGKTADDLSLTSEAYYQENGINYLLNDKVVSIDKQKKQVITASGRVESYHKLILATGSFPFVPPIPGNDQAHIHVYRTIDDLDAITESGQVSEVGVVIGGGLLGLEAANALTHLGLKTHIVEFAPRLMAVQLDDGGGQLLQRKIEALGVNVHTEKATTEIIKGEQQRYRMNFADGSFLETDTIIFSAGIRPQDELAKQSALTIGDRGGIVINDHCVTCDNDIYAIGECALWNNQIFGLVAPGYQMAKVAVANILGQPETFNGADMSTKLKLLGVDVASIGDVHGKTKGTRAFTYHDEMTQVYKRMIISEDGKKLVGTVLVGDTEAYSILLQHKQNNLDLPENPSLLILPNVEPDKEVTSGATVLPDTASICSCFGVTKADIKQAVSNGCSSISELKQQTKASTGCGGCSALAKQVLDSELALLGHSVDTNICEHFAYSRKQLADIIRIKQITTFDQLLAEYGDGYGCELCKPAVANILASYWNEHILDDIHLELQDSNDIYLGNIQKNGTYSIVPRIPGGEITPDKLIILGQIANKYNLYTKITGGQRIDLFGAQLHELPIIWKELVDSGFETGHAYGKSVRTVKSCVGNSWCRYGLKDSISMSIDIENRYKGLRSPHKLKFAVSGCTRECAEAQSKDVGIIATENGWNLYLCGNGGMRPRHADLFASGLDKQTLQLYIDRFLMFYIRTADRLQRTSVWLENLEGGLDYLKQVIIDDKLKICKELEQEISHNINQYQCEWKATINTSEKLKRFQHFVNSKQTDDNLSFKTSRLQRFPKNKKDQNINILQVTK
ncbi:MAG: nitrite reductase large subunit [Psychromonas sp.]|nr:nitrite reductase large subunit [Alteromonadales bacterium]MCP5076753.1 nitrite reductase large subunit [Psychromonas sp.]